jgi:hypothetical protein
MKLLAKDWRLDVYGIYTTGIDSIDVHRVPIPGMKIAHKGLDFNPDNPLSAIAGKRMDVGSFLWTSIPNEPD